MSTAFCSLNWKGSQPPYLASNFALPNEGWWDVYDSPHMGGLCEEEWWMGRAEIQTDNAVWVSLILVLVILIEPEEVGAETSSPGWQAQNNS